MLIIRCGVYLLIVLIGWVVLVGVVLFRCRLRRGVMVLRRG